MESTNYKEATFEQYYANKLSKKAAKAFEQRLEKEGALRNAFAQYVLIREASQDQARADFRARFSNSTSTESATPRVLPIRRILSIAAGLLILLSASWLLYQQTNYWASIQQMADEALQHQNNSITYLGSEEEQRTANEYALEQGQNFLKIKEFSSAIKAFDQVSRISEAEYDDYILAKFQKATAYIHLQDKEKALEELKAIQALKEQHYLKAEAETLIKALNKKPFFSKEQ